MSDPRDRKTVEFLTRQKPEKKRVGQGRNGGGGGLGCVRKEKYKHHEAKITRISKNDKRPGEGEIVCRNIAGKLDFEGNNTNWGKNKIVKKKRGEGRKGTKVKKKEKGGDLTDQFEILVWY